MEPVTKTWTDITGPLVRRCEVAAATNNNAVWNPVGAKALGNLLKNMARIIDDEIELRRAFDRQVPSNKTEDAK